MKLHTFIAVAIASSPLLFVPTLAQTPQTAKPAKPTPPATAPAAKGAVRTIEIVGTDQMKYDVTTIPAKRNEQLRVRLSVEGDDAEDRHGAQLGAAQARARAR